MIRFGFVTVELSNCKKDVARTLQLNQFYFTIIFFLVVSCAQCPNASSGQICESRYKLPINCNAGELPSQNGTVCIRCRPGYYCRTPQEGEVACAVGQWSLGGATECNDCPKGYACANSGSLPQPCDLGHYTNVINSLTCNQCQAGFKCPTTSGNRVACTAGKTIFATAADNVLPVLQHQVFLLKRCLPSLYR